MSRIIAAAAIKGAHKEVAAAEQKLKEAMESAGATAKVEFPNTAYYLPIIYGMTGVAVQKLEDMNKVLDICKGLLPPVPKQDRWLPYLGHTLDAGMATLFAGEIIEGCKYTVGPNPVSDPWLGAADDVIMRERGVEFVDGSAPGFCALVGKASSADMAEKILLDLLEKNLYVWMSGDSPDGSSITDQFIEKGRQIGWDTRTVPYGQEISAAVYSLGFAARAAMAFGGAQPGEYSKILRYNKNRVFAFVLALDYVDERKYAYAAGAINYGFPAIGNTPIPQILPTGVCTYEHVVSNIPEEEIVQKCVEVRGLKIQIAKVPIPVAFGAAFEGERIRKDDMYVQFGGNITPGFEYLKMAEMDDVTDGSIELIGPDVDDIEAGTALPLGIVVEVAGRKMQEDFEPIFERQFHNFINAAEGVWTMGQRDIIWMRISKKAKEKGFKIKHFGDILYTKVKNDYPSIVDKVQVKIYTEEAKVKEALEEAKKAYRNRDEKTAGMTDESVDLFYSCTLCQSFAPTHVCVVSPERLGLCGAYNWLDCKAAFEIDPTGPNQPIQKGNCLDETRGMFDKINEFVLENSGNAIGEVNLYSMMENPMTSCGCFECIAAFLPLCNGIMLVNREYPGMTPSGMSFSTLAGSVGGGAQTPGFMGLGKVYITSKKFISADGGFERLVWMPKELKESLSEQIAKRCEEIGDPDFVNKIADETSGTTEEEVFAFLESVAHPALAMDPMFE